MAPFGESISCSGGHSGPETEQSPGLSWRRGSGGPLARLAFGENRTHFAEKGGSAIPIAASLIGLAVAGLVAALIAARSAGFIHAAAQTLTVVLASLTGALLGFFIPLIPFADGIHGNALAAGILGTLGTIGGMSVADYCLAWFERPR